MVIDSSALIAIFQKEPEAELFDSLINNSENLSLSAANYFETMIVLQARGGDENVADFRLYLREANIQIRDLTATQAELALQAFRQFGKGRHPAALNFGDCIAYALAKDLGKGPLLFKGHDFSQTDILSAI
jgi:ribonuclease VapC